MDGECAVKATDSRATGRAVEATPVTNIKPTSCGLDQPDDVFEQLPTFENFSFATQIRPGCRLTNPLELEYQFIPTPRDIKLTFNVFSGTILRNSVVGATPEIIRYSPADERMYIVDTSLSSILRLDPRNISNTDLLR